MGALSDLRRQVREAYSAAAENPGASHVFPVGREFAASLGYAPELLADLPARSVEAFSGVTNLTAAAEIRRGENVLDLGCGAGLDALIAARMTGDRGRVVGLDFSTPMLLRSRAAAIESGSANVLFCRGDAECMPLPNASVDVALVNGIFNLNPARGAIFRELARVIRPGGAAYAAELVLAQPLAGELKSAADWFA